MPHWLIANMMSDEQEEALDVQKTSVTDFQIFSQ